MKLKDFTPDVARQVIDLWEQHLGFFYKNRLCMDSPEFLASEVQDLENWATGRFEPRIGSKFTDDSKLLVYFVGGDIEVKCYAQAHTAIGKERRHEAERAEESFNKAVKDYIRTLR